MAGYSAIAAAAKSLERLLSKRFALDQPVPAPAVTKAVLVSTDDFDLNGQTVIKPPALSIFLVRVEVNRVTRAAWSAVGAEEERVHLPLDLHFLLTAWAKDASLQHTIAGWMMRVLEDTPSLPPGLLNRTYANVFHPNETVELSLAELSTEELFRIWEVIAENAYQISIPYVARVVRIESRILEGEGEVVQQRVFGAGTVTPPIATPPR